jgi:ribosome-interacting GTPase 1
MPANLPAQARNKWNEATVTRNPKRKVELLQEFLSLVPKHKAGSRVSKFSVEKEGAAQIVVLGGTKVGRSSLLMSVTNAKAEVSEYPFTTFEPVPGMLFFEDLRFQIVEVPAIVRRFSERKTWAQQTFALARNADALILMVDLSKNPCDQITILLDELDNARILVKKPNARVEIKREHMGFGLRILVIGELVDCTLKDAEILLRSYRISNALVRIFGSATLDDIEDSIFESVVFLPSLVVANKVDINGARAKLNDLKGFLNSRLKVIGVSCKTGFGLNELGRELFNLLKIIRVYTKEPRRKKLSLSPFTLKKGSTVGELTRQIHSDFFNRFFYARVWSKRLPFSPQKVGLSFVLEDKDIIELHVH